MTIKDIVASKEYRSVVEDYRDTCLWFAGNVLEPQDRMQLEQVLSSIESYGDMAAMEAGEVVFHEGRICGAWPQIVER